MAEEENLKTQNEKLKKKIKDITSSLQKIAECPICLDTVKVPFKICSTGHGVCSACCDRLQRCPTCKDPFILENPIGFKNLLEALPQDCRHSDAGCEEILEQGSDHEEFCGYRPIACQETPCTVTVPLIRLIDHWNADHADEFVIRDKTLSLFWRGFNPKQSCISYHVISLFGHIFWLSYNNDVKKKHFKLTFQGTPIGNLKNSYFAKVGFKDGKFVYTSTIKASVSSSCEIEQHSSEVDNNPLGLDSDVEEYYMTIPQSTLHRFINPEGALQFSVVFFEEKK